MTYRPRYFPDGRKMYDPNRTERQIHEEWAAFEHAVIIEDPDCPFPDMRARELWRQEEQTKERWSEWQQRVWIPRQVARPDTTLTAEEWQHLLETFDGANHPLSASIHRKASEALS